MRIIYRLRASLRSGYRVEFGAPEPELTRAKEEQQLAAKAGAPTGNQNAKKEKEKNNGSITPVVLPSSKSRNTGKSGEINQSSNAPPKSLGARKDAAYVRARL